MLVMFFYIICTVLVILVDRAEENGRRARKADSEAFLARMRRSLFWVEPPQ